VESDVTDLSAMLKSAQSGMANLGNFVGVYGANDYNGIIYANARLEFYPAGLRDRDRDPDRDRDRETRVPDVVIGLQGDSDAAALSTTANQLSKTLTLPTNVESAYLDVIAQNQASDEFWYQCVPADLAKAVGRCTGTGFRETEVSIDGQPAGVAPIYPWIFTGGLDPYYWEPIPSVQTLNLKRYRVDLTPFAGLLSDGRPHTVALSVFDAVNNFAVTATLLLYTDPSSRRVTGGVLSNDLAPQPSPTVTENVISAGNGSVTVASERHYGIRGYVETSHGRVKTTVWQTLSFSSSWSFYRDLVALKLGDDLTQSTTVDARTVTLEGRSVTEEDRTFSYPFTVHTGIAKNSAGHLTATGSVDQKYLTTGARLANGVTVYTDQTSNEVATQSNSGIGVASQRGSSQNYLTSNSRGYCYSRQLTSAESVLTGVVDGAGCPADTWGNPSEE
jgi:hypothetical protein